MADFKRGRGESTSAWCARLGEVKMGSLSARQLDELTLRRVLAGRALLRETRSRLRKLALPAETNGAESEQLRQCKEAVQALADEDRCQLIRWIETSFVE